ncbi:uncharacterized protein G2W53_028678 [Senna tora]|uniref:Uncharacterized protein n=1 Tax=Senna tora TaxID=362788 RepID=A0A834TCQ8_9FABA|nr:uncharacterized protein G2W53_028678 [Senna tora]
MSVRIVFANQSGFDAPIGVVLAWEERGSCLNISRMTNRGRVLETFTNYEAKDLLRKSVGVVLAIESGFYVPIGVVMAWEERGSCLNIFRTTNRGRISETFMNYEEKDLLRKSVDHVLAYSGRQIAVRSQKPSRIMRQKICCASESNTSVRITRSMDHVLTYSGRQIAVGSQKPSRITRQKTCCARAWIMSQYIPNDESGSDLRNLHELRGKRLVAQVSQHTSVRVTRSVDHVLTYSGRQIAVGSQKPSRITRQQTCCASESNTSVRVVFANRSGFDAPIGVILAWEERGSCPNIFWTKNRGRISETFTNYEPKDSLRKSVDHVLTYSGRQIAVGYQKPSRITRKKTCCASGSNMSVRVLFANRSGFNAPIGVVLAWKERGSSVNIFRTTNRGRISETFTNYVAKDLLRKSVDHVLTYSGRQITVGSQKPSRITRNLHELRGKRLVAQVRQTRRFVLYLRTGVVLMLQLESSWYGRSMDHVLTYSGRQITVGSQKSSRITRQKTCCTSESNTSVRVVVANRGVFDAPIGVVLAWEERGSCLNILGTTNRDRVSESLMNYEGKDSLRKSRLGMRGAWIMSQHIRDDKSRSDLKNLHELRGKRLIAQVSQIRRPVAQVSQTRWFALYLLTGVVLMPQLESSWHGRSVDHVLTYSGQQIAVGSQKPSRIMRKKTCCASESNTLVRVVFANRSGFDAPIGVVLAWEERGSCLNIFRMTNRGWISETFTNYEAKHLLCNESNTSVSVVFANQSGFDSPIKVILAWEERGSCLNIFWMTNRGWISETFMNYEAKDLLRKSMDHVLAYSERQIAVGYQKPSRSSRQKTCCASESNTSVSVVFANQSGFDAPIGVVLAWEERG